MSGAPPVFARLGIVGLGLIGGSIARAVRETWPATEVTGVDRPEVLEAALQQGVVAQGSEHLSVLEHVDAVILAAPVRQNCALLADLGRHIRPDTVVTDTGSTKRDIVRAAAALASPLTFVGGHPLGGAAASGIEHARADLFAGRPWLFTPDSTTPPEALERCVSFATSLGAVPHLLTADEHDRTLAFVSHLPQLVTSALMQVVGDAVGAEGLALAGKGLHDSTRLASSPASIWRDIASANAEHLAVSIEALITVLASLRADLPEGTQLDRVFERARRWRDELASHSQL